jgi:ankyrin repeat protein
VDRPFHLAAQTGRTDVVKLLLEHWLKGMWKTNREGYTPLHSVASEGKVDVVPYLVGLWPGGKMALAMKGRTPLMIFEEFAMDKVDNATTAEMVALPDTVGRYRLTMDLFHPA